MEKKIKMFWLYSIMLFGIAFVLILFSSFSSGGGQKTEDGAVTVYQGSGGLSAESEGDENQPAEEAVPGTVPGAEDQKAIIAALENEKEALITQRGERAAETAEFVKSVDRLAAAQIAFDAKNYSAAREALNEVYTGLLPENGKALYTKIDRGLTDAGH